MPTGEYWIQNGSPCYCDGSVGDETHESLVIQHAQNLFQDYSDRHGSFENYLRTRLNAHNPNWEALYKAPGCLRGRDWYREALCLCESDEDKYLLDAALDLTDLRTFAMREWDWIWVRKNNIGLWALGSETLRSLERGIDAIIELEDLSEPFQLRVGIQSTGKFQTASSDNIQNLMPETRAPETWSSQVRAVDRAGLHPYYATRNSEA